MQTADSRKKLFRFLVLFGFLSLFVGAFSLIESLPYRGGATTTGIVVGHWALGTNLDEGSTIRFVDGNGVSHDFRNSVSRTDPPAIGSAVQVNYMPDNPSKARVQGESIPFAVIFLLIGIPTLLIGVAGILGIALPFLPTLNS